MGLTGTEISTITNRQGKSGVFVSQTQAIPIKSDINTVISETDSRAKTTLTPPI